VFVAAGTEWRPSAGSCDIAEACSGSSASFPADDTGDSDGDAISDPTDLCPTTADPGNLDRDDDGLGDACDPCTNLLDIFAQKSRVRLSDMRTVGSGKTFRFKGILDGVPSEPPIDPVANGVRILLANKLPSAPLIDVTVPGGEGWKVNTRGTSFRYRNKAGYQGITKVRVRMPARRPGRVKFRVVGKNLYFDQLDEQELTGTLVIDAPIAIDGQCGEAIFPNALGGACKRSRNGARLVCR
jgi:hypothetical protein